LTLLRNIQENARHPVREWAMLGAVFFWPLIGGAAGYWAATLAGLAATALTAAITVGMLVGFCVGLYAAMSASRLAFVLSLPGIVFYFWT
jgi:hypothetical protein